MTKRERALASLRTNEQLRPADGVGALKRCNDAVAAQSGKAAVDRMVVLTLRVERAQKGGEGAVRGNASLPHGIGRSKRVAVFCKPDRVAAVTSKGAVAAGGADLVARIKEGFFDFDVVLATPDMMGLVGPLGRVLGPKGMMPSPKAGTVTENVESLVDEFIKGRVEFRADDAGNLHIPVGRTSFESEKLAENIAAACRAVRAAKPASVKGSFITALWVTATMLPAFRLIEENAS